MLASERAPYDAFLELRASEHPQDGLMGCDPHDALKARRALYDGLRLLNRHTRERKDLTVQNFVLHPLFFLTPLLFMQVLKNAQKT